MDRFMNHHSGRQLKMRVALLGLLTAAGIVIWFLNPADDLDTGVPSQASTDSAYAELSVEGVGDYRALLSRSQQEYGSAKLNLTDAPAMPGELLLQAKNQQQYDAILSQSGEAGWVIIGRLDRSHTLRVRITDPAKLASWLNQTEVEVSPNYLVTVPGLPGQDKAATISLDEFLPMGDGLLEWVGLPAGALSGRGIKIAVLDTGIAPHSAFTGSSLFRLDLEGGDGSPGDPGHGTAVASLIAGNSRNVSGLAPGVDLLDIPVLNAQGWGDSFTLAQGIYAATDAGVQIINLSLGSQGQSGIVQQAVADALARGVAIIAATGNEGAGQIAFPASLPGVVAVGATDAAGRVLPFSNTGMQAGLTAPGFSLRAAWPGEKMVEISGTSSAVPLVAGALATIMAHDPNLSAGNAVQLLYDYSDEAGAPGIDQEYGHGILNLSRVLNRNTRGIYDVAVASQYLSPQQAATLESQRSGTVEVIVENRGTETAYQIQLANRIAGYSWTQLIAQLPAGATTVIPVRVAHNAAGQIELNSSVKISREETNVNNNSLSYPERSE
jgi:thermitase